MPFHLFLFDEEGDADQQDAGDDSQIDQQDEKPAPKAKPAKRAVSARSSASDANEAYELRAALEEARAAAESAKARVAELNSENVKRRKAAEQLETRLNTADKRVIRAEAVEALQEKGVISKRVVSLFLEDLGDKVKIDERTGDPIGIRENLDAWIAANKEFFKLQQEAEADKADDEKQKTEEKEPLKKNATATGASTGGAAGSGKNTGGLPDLRNLTPKERKDALDAYKRSLRRG